MENGIFTGVTENGSTQTMTQHFCKNIRKFCTLEIIMRLALERNGGDGGEGEREAD